MANGGRGIGRGIAMGLAGAMAALLSQASGAAPIAMPAGSTVWMHFEASPCPDADGDDCIGSNLPGLAPPNGIPTSTFTEPGKSSTGYAEILPDQVRTQVSGNFTSTMRASFQDTYTVHGNAVGSFPITVVLSAAGTASSMVTTPNHYLLQGGVEVEIGTFDPTDLPMSEQFRVTPFNASETGVQSLFSNTTGAPVQVPVAVSSSHALTVAVGDVFDLAYGVNPGVGKGTIDMTGAGAGASISFVLPEGVWLTSALGGVFGTEPAPACSDDLDNDGDALVDFPADPGCADAADLDEHDPTLPCDDGADNDGDGLIDFPADPGCPTPTSALENPACNDGLDNDQDGGTDWDGGPFGLAPDGQCVGKPGRDIERAGGCGLGAELALLMPSLLWMCRRRVAVI